MRAFCLICRGARTGQGTVEKAPDQRKMHAIASIRPFRRPLSKKTGPAIRLSCWLVTAAAGCAAARRIPYLSTYAAAPRMLTNTGCTALHVVPANGQELNAVNGFGEDQFVYLQAPFLSP